MADMRMRLPKINTYYKIIIVAIICSLALAVPLLKLTLSWSMETSYSLYGVLTRITHLHSPAIVRLDENGVPIVDYGYQKGEYVGLKRNPLTIAATAISYYEEFTESEEVTERSRFLSCIHWLEEFRIDKGDYSLWAYEFDAGTYNVSAPWYSAMAQARIMVAFERAFELTQNVYYIQLADEAMQALKIPIDQGGVLYIDPQEGSKWYAEVAGGGRAIPPFILNGFIYSLLDLYDVYVRTGSQEAISLFQDGIIELKRHLIDYDTGQWTYYDRENNLAYDYHYVHIDQLQQLHEITHDIEFKVFHDKWASYFPINPLWARQRFAAYLLDATLIFIFLVVVTIAYKTYKKKSSN